jgi:hypothetical protein
VDALRLGKRPEAPPGFFDVTCALFFLLNKRNPSFRTRTLEMLADGLAARGAEEEGLLEGLLFRLYMVSRPRAPGVLGRATVWTLKPTGARVGWCYLHHGDQSRYAGPVSKC